MSAPELISEAWREQNRLLHETDNRFGAGSRNVYKMVEATADDLGCESILDYGCGKGGLRGMLGERVRNYDPAIPEWSALPEPADLVVCRDVMEHVEIDCVDNVLAHIAGLAAKAALFIVVCRPSSKVMPNGVNAHITVRPRKWWGEKMREHFVVLSERRPEGEDSEVVAFICNKKGA